MPSVAVHPSPVADTMAPATVDAQRPVLRRAVYIHVSDLTSAYNINHGKLEEELSRVQAVQQSTVESSSASRFAVPTELDTTPTQKRLQPPKCGYNLVVLVGSIEVVVDKYRVDRSRVRLAEVQVGDETGTVSMRARDDQIDVLEEISHRSGAVVLRNCTVELYQGKHIRLSISKWGKMCPYPDSVASTPAQPSKMNIDRNFSLIDLSVVATELIEESYPQTAEEGGPSNKGGSSPHGYPRRGPRGLHFRPQPFPQVAPPPHGRPSNPPRLQYDQGGPHGYRMYEGMEAQQYPPWPRQSQTVPHQMFSPYEMQQQQQQQQQMQQHFQGDHQRGLLQPPSMIAPRVTHSSGSFETPAPGIPSSFQLLSTSHHPQQQPQHQMQFVGRPESPSPQGRMNPQAATFDPAYGSHQQRRGPRQRQPHH